MNRTKRPLRLARETIRDLRTVELRQAHGGLLATSEAFDGYPCPGEYSYICKP